MESQASDDSQFEVMPLSGRRKISDLTNGDVEVILDSLADFQAQVEDIEDLPTGLISGFEQLREKLELTGIPVR